MSIRQVRKKDELLTIQNLLNKLNIDYATSDHAKNDFYNKSIRFYELVENEKIIAICSIVPEPVYNYLAIKRLVILDRNDRGKGYGRKLIEGVLRKQKESCGCTPWITNKPMQKLLSSLGFKYQYTFKGYWTFWKI